ncbi:hypothetical protein [Pseudomonas aeruginosa]|uniref:hypothetical protein n=1 Tax=Pseudomonas aeruginosa TaxID=287 RepID=UPI003D9C4544
MSFNDAFSQRQQEILLKAALLAAFALVLTFPRRAPPGAAPVGADQHHGPGGRGDPPAGDYKTSLPILDDGEIGDPAWPTSPAPPAG